MGRGQPSVYARQGVGAGVWVKTRVLVVDDSAFMRQSVSRVLAGQPDFEIVGVAADGIEGVALVRRLKPDIVTMDVEMPHMDGLQALAIIMRDMPVPVVMLSSLTAAGAPATIRALELGAIDFIPKPAPPAVGVSHAAVQMVRVMRAAAQVRVQALRTEAVEAAAAGSRPAPEPLYAKPRRTAVDAPADRVLAIGCSTGGPKALAELVPHLPANLPAAVLIVQHMPAGFTRSLAERLDRLSPLAVKEAEHGDVAAAGQVLIAPGGKHLAVNPRGVVELNEAPAEHGVRPAVNVLFRSLPGCFGSRVVAAVLTGMGSDGAEGASLIRAAGGRVVTEDASTTVVYGMPRAVAECGAAERQLPLGEVAACVTDLVLTLSRAAAARRAS